MIDLLNNSIVLSEQLLALCHADKWDEVKILQEERHELMSQFANTPLPKDDKTLDLCKELTLKLTAISKEIEVISKRHKEDIFTEIKSMNKSKRMNTAYGQ